MMSDFSCEVKSKKNSARGEMAINLSSAVERVRIGKDEMDFSDAGQSGNGFLRRRWSNQSFGDGFLRDDSQLQYRHSTNRG